MSVSVALFSLMLLLTHERSSSIQASPGLAAAPIESSESVRVPGGRFRPLYGPGLEPEELAVTAFGVDRDPVTNEQFLRFVALYPKYRRGRISPLFADSGYLSHWAGPTELGAGVRAGQPVVRVSWFAAKAFCQAAGKRLPTELQWEYVASASETSPDARRDPEWRERILSWYAKPAAAVLPAVGASRPNYYGVRDLHGLIWEWVLDWNSALIGSDSRSGTDRQAFCGAGALGSGDASDYASFMRSAFRSSLRAEYTAQSLGFRCASLVTKEAP